MIYGLQSHNNIGLVVFDFFLSSEVDTSCTIAKLQQWNHSPGRRRPSFQVAEDVLSTSSATRTWSGVGLRKETARSRPGDIRAYFSSSVFNPHHVQLPCRSAHPAFRGIQVARLTSWSLSTTNARVSSEEQDSIAHMSAYQFPAAHSPTGIFPQPTDPVPP